MVYKKITCAVVFLLTLSTQANIKVNGVDINTIIKPGEVLCYTDKKSNCIALFYQNKNLQIGSCELTQPNQVEAFLKKVENSGLNKFSGNSVNLHAGVNSTHKGTHIIGKEEIFLSAGNSIDIENSILQSPHIFLVADKFIFSACFIRGSKYVQLESCSKNALFKAIKFSFPENPLLPPMIQGTVDLEAGVISEDFLVPGAVEVEILLNDSVFKN